MPKALSIWKTLFLKSWRCFDHSWHQNYGKCKPYRINISEACIWATVEESYVREGYCSTLPVQSAQTNYFEQIRLLKKRCLSSTASLHVTFQMPKALSHHSGYCLVPELKQSVLFNNYAALCRPILNIQPFAAPLSLTATDVNFSALLMVNNSW